MPRTILTASKVVRRFEHGPAHEGPAHAQNVVSAPRARLMSPMAIPANAAANSMAMDCGTLERLRAIKMLATASAIDTKAAMSQFRTGVQSHMSSFLA